MNDMYLSLSVYYLIKKNKHIGNSLSRLLRKTYRLLREYAVYNLALYSCYITQYFCVKQIKYINKQIFFKMKFITALYLLFSVNNVFAQELISQSPKLIKSVLTQAGSSTVSFEHSDASGVVRTTHVRQSIGQHGTVGLSNTSLSSVQQGFLNRINTLKVDNTNSEFVKTFDLLSIFPNPFKEFVKIKFSKLPVHLIQVEVFDVRGRLVLNQEFPPSSLILVPTERLEDASYTIRVSSGSQEYLKKIIKGIN